VIAACALWLVGAPVAMALGLVLVVPAACLVSGCVDRSEVASTSRRAR